LVLGQWLKGESYLSSRVNQLLILFTEDRG